jgi:hypothetical protein
MDTTAAFKARIEGFLEEFKMAPTRFGREAARDPAFVFRLREGRSVRVRRMDQIDQWMATYRKTARGKGDPSPSLRKCA